MEAKDAWTLFKLMDVSGAICCEASNQDSEKTS